MSFLAENGIYGLRRDYELHDEPTIYQRAHEMAFLYAVKEACLSQIRAKLVLRVLWLRVWDSLGGFKVYVGQQCMLRSRGSLK